MGAAIGALAVWPSAAGAANIPVTTTTDVVANDELCSLREAITAATTNAPVARGGGGDDCPAGDSNQNDTIQLAAATYSIATTTSGPGGSENGNADGDFDLDFTGDPGFLTIDGVLGAGDVPQTILDAGDIDRFFDLQAGGPTDTATLEIREVIIRNGKPPEPNSHGGGILVRDDDAQFDLTSARIEASDALGWGGGMSVNSGQTAAPDIDVTQVEFSGNTAVDDGGGLWIDGPEDVNTFQIRRSAIVNNHSDQMGGGIYIKQDGDTDDEPVVEIFNSTVSGNTATVSGGGIAFAFGLGGTLFMEFTTIAGNSTPAAGMAGGIQTTVGVDEFIQGTGIVLAGNLANGVPSNCVPEDPPEFGSSSTSVESGGAQCFAGSTMADPLLGPLTYNATGDQTTRTHALGSGSPAIDKLVAASCDGTTDAQGVDQRGVARPIGGGCDAGAFEAPLPAVTTPPDTQPSPPPPANKKCKKKKKKKKKKRAASAKKKKKKKGCKKKKKKKKK